MTARSDADRLSGLARQFREFLIHQTNVSLHDFGVESAACGPVALRAALERLDAALDQMSDLASVYADTNAGSLEPLIYPVAVLTGEYIRDTIGGQWQPPDDDAPPGDGTLNMKLTDGEVVDLTSVVRVAILAGTPSLSVMVRT